MRKKDVDIKFHKIRIELSPKGLRHLENLERLSLSAKGLRRNVPTRIVGRPSRGALTLEKLLIMHPGNFGRTWILNDLEIDNVSQLPVKDLPGELFMTSGQCALDFCNRPVIEQTSVVAVLVTYIGESFEMPEMDFLGMILGDVPAARPTVLPIVTKNKLPTGVMTMISVTLDQPFVLNKLEIENTDTDEGAADWVVNDIRADGTSQFNDIPADGTSQLITANFWPHSNMPGDAFAVRQPEGLINLPPSTHVELRVTYIGDTEGGCCFTGRFLGTVVRDDLSQPPPDVNAIVRISGEDFEKKVVGHCDWRVPYMEN